MLIKCRLFCWNLGGDHDEYAQLGFRGSHFVTLHHAEAWYQILLPKH